MTKTTRPTDPQDSFGPDAEPRPWLREWVRQHMLKMAPLAMVGATSLTNTACDPAPSPSLCDDPYSWQSQVVSRASWGEEHGNRIVILDLGVSNGDLAVPTSYTIAGGSLLTSGKSDQLRIKPDAGAEVITLQGQMTCDGIRGLTIRITIDLVPPDAGSADSAPTVKVS